MCRTSLSVRVECKVAPSLPSHRSQAVRCVILVVMFVVSASPAEAQERSLWQIGKRDNASLEFNQGWDFSQGHDPVFIVGRSDPRKDWSHIHPGPADSASGLRVHPFTIQFDLNGAPQGTFYFVVDVFFKEPLIPAFLIDVNGKKGQYLFHPRISYELGDFEMYNDIIPSTQHLQIPLPASFFHQGANQLILSCVGASGTAILQGESKVGGESRIYYDDLALSNDPGARYQEKHLQGEAHPTIFYRQGESNQLREVILLEAESRGRFESGRATLRLGAEKYACNLPGGYDFGESECAVEVREFSGTASGNLAVRMGKVARSFEVELKPEKKWKLYEVAQNHIDTGYTDYRPKAYELHNRDIDEAMEAIQAHPWYKYNLDGSFDLEQYWLHRDEGRQQAVVQALRNDRMGLPAELFTQDTGLASQEGLYRLAYFSENLGKRYGIPVQYANQTDVPAHSWALPSYLHAMGIKYLAIASDPYRGPVLLYGRLNEKSPFWWEGPDGNKVLTWYSWDYIQVGFLFGMKVPTPQAGVTSLPIFLQPYSSTNYRGDAVMLYGNLSDNRPFNPYDIDFSQEWNRNFAYPKFIMATMPDFFKYMEENFSSSFVTLRGDGGATWEEMIAADAQHGGIARKAADRVIGAEALASLGVIVNKGFRFPMDEDRDVWDNLLLYLEHSWGGIGRTWRHPDEELVKVLFRSKQAFSTQAEIEVDNLLRRGLDQLTSRVSVPGNTVLVFNPLSWERGGLVEVDVPRGQGLVDTETQQAIPLELVGRGKEEDYDAVRFWADKVPALGYRCYAVRRALQAEVGQAVAGGEGRVLENEFYKITVDLSRGGITSIYDKELRRELVDQHSPYVVDQYVYAGYGHEGESLIRQRTAYNSTLLQYGNALPAPDLQVSTGGGGRAVGVKKTTWGAELRMESSAAHTPKIETDIRLFDGVKRIELINRVHKEVVRAPEAVYFAFPLAGEKPSVRFEIQDGWVDPSRDELPGANTEWFSAQHWVAISDAEHTVGLALDEAPLLTIGDIDRGRWPKRLEAKDGTIFSYIMNNYDGDDELPYQGGNFTFHYALSSTRAFDPAALARFSREEDVRLEKDKEEIGINRYKPREEPLKAQRSSFISVGGSEVILSAWKAAEDGKGYVLRFYNTTDRAVETEVGFPHLEFDRAYRCNAAEVEQGEARIQDGKVKISLGPHEIGTYRLTGFRLRP